MRQHPLPILNLVLFSLGLTGLTAGESATEVSALKAQLAESRFATMVEESQGKLQWGKGKNRFVVVAVDGVGKAAAPQVETPIGRVTINPRMADQKDLDAADLLARCLVQAQTANLKAPTDKPAELRPSLLLGHHLRIDEVRVLPEDVLRASKVGQDRSKETQALVAAAQALGKELDKTSLEPLAQSCVQHLLGQLDGKAGNPGGEEINPGFARQVVAAGWLEQMLGERPAIKAVRQALSQAMAMQDIDTLTGTRLKIRHFADAWGQDGYLHEDGTVVRLALHPPVPMYIGPTSGWVLVDLPNGTDPIKDPSAVAKATAIRLVLDQELASWKPPADFKAETTVWRQVFGQRPGRIANYFPPHIAVPDLHGNLVGVIVPKGMVKPPAAATPAAAEAFLDQAAKLLPDGAHLDLVAQYFLKYVFDSPDTAMPMMIGNKENKGDIHQTAVQTVSSVCGGVFRGDCDDMAELAQDLLIRQGKLAHVISLPAHAACAWAEKKTDGWHVMLLQTGPAVEVSAPELPKALEAIYRGSDSTQAFDPNGLGLLLRFSGENTRGAWRLGWRIFQDKNYAETMIDVQKDWHFQTYLQGIRKMEKLIAAGDKDTANFRELAGLFNFTGQYAKAAEYEQKALELTPEATSKVMIKGEIVHHLFKAGKNDAARKILDELLTKDLKDEGLKKALGEGIIELALEAAGYLADGGPVDQAGRVFRESNLLTIAQRMVLQLNTLIDRGTHQQEIWNQHPQLKTLRRILMRIAMVSLGVLERAEPAARKDNADLAALAKLVDDWAKKVAMADLDDAGDIPLHWGMVGRLMALSDPDFLTKVETAALPTTNERVDHVKIAADPIARLGWIKASPSFWATSLSTVVEDHGNTPPRPADRTLVKRLAKGLEEADKAAQNLKLVNPQVLHQTAIARLQVALLLDDGKMLHEQLKMVKKKNDKRLRDDATQAIGDCSIHLSEASFDKALKAWQEDIDYKPKYFWIAWRAALQGAAKAALKTAELAAKRFKDDSDFVDEYTFMKELFGRPAK